MNRRAPVYASLTSTAHAFWVSKRRKRPAKRRSRRRSSKRVAIGFGGAVARNVAEAGVFVLSGISVCALALAWFARDLPSTENLWRTDRSAKITVLARDGSPLSNHGASRGDPIRLSDLPPYAPLAVLAIEDRNFRHHVGVNPFSVARAFVVNAREGEVRQGGSTITQQLAKNLFLSPERTVKRKMQELLLAFWLEYRFTKDEILTLYLNRVYFGGGAHGIDAASYRYFGKSARQLSLSEAAILAGLLKAPSRYAPTRNPSDAGARARLVLDAMVEARFLSAAEARRARAQPVQLAAGGPLQAPYFVDFAVKTARARVREIDADLVIRTTLDRKLQRALDDGVAAGIGRIQLDDHVQVAAVILDTEGAILAMSGGRNYGASQFNRAAQARRQSGSAFKPFIFAAALEAGGTPDARVLDAPISVGRWTPNNYNGRFFRRCDVSRRPRAINEQRRCARSRANGSKRRAADGETHGRVVDLVERAVAGVRR